MYFYYDFKTMAGVEYCGLETSDNDFDETKIEDKKYIKSFLKKHANNYIKSSKIVNCELFCEWYVKITVDMSCVDVNDFINKELELINLNYLIHSIDKEKYEDLFSSNGATSLELKDKYLKLGYLSFNQGKLKIYFEKVKGKKKDPHTIKVISIDITE